MTLLILPRSSQLHRVHQCLAGAQVADDHQIVTWRSQSCVLQIFLGRFDGDIRIIGKFYSYRISSPTKCELTSNFLVRSEGKNRGVFRTQVGGIARHRAVAGKDDDTRTWRRVSREG